MANRPRIGVTGNKRRFTPSWWCISLALRIVGADPVRISVRHHGAAIEALDGLIISGGDDISPDQYAGKDELEAKLDVERDALEIQWIKDAMKQSIPLLGICRGAQLINVVLGGTLHQDLRQLRKHTYNRPGLLPTKQVFLKEDSMIRQTLGMAKLRVNSLHHQAINELGKGLSVVGEDLDNITQAIENSEGAPIVGVQWHPEYLMYLPSQLRIFRWITEGR